MRQQQRPMEQQQQHMQRPGLEGQTGPVTIAEALTVAGRQNPDREIDLAVVSSIQSAEGRATGVREGVPNGPASVAHHVLERKSLGMEDPQRQMRMGAILERAKDIDTLRKPVNRRDVQKVTEAEVRNDPTGCVDPNGISAVLDRAAEWNIEQGFVNPNAQ